MAYIYPIGAPYYDYRFSDTGVKKLIESEALFERILRYDREGFIMSITTAGTDTASASGDRSGPASGILPGHAYTLVSAVQLSNGAKLLRGMGVYGVKFIHSFVQFIVWSAYTFLLCLYYVLIFS